MERQRITRGEAEKLPLPWYERLLQRPESGLLPFALALVAAAVIGFLGMVYGLFRPITGKDIQFFFGSVPKQGLVNPAPEP